MAVTDTDALTIAGKTLSSRLLLGTGGFRSLEALSAALAASGSELVTVALRRIDPSQRGSIVDVLDAAGVKRNVAISQPDANTVVVTFGSAASGRIVIR
jgi:thiazole synthase